MKVLIIGMGFSGSMFLEVFQNISNQYNRKIDIAYTARNKKDVSIIYYPSTEQALNEFNPDVVVVAVNDENHGQVLSLLEDYKGFVICEKPLVDPDFDLDLIDLKLSGISNFCLNMVARYSKASLLLKSFVEKHELKLIRADFLWEKNRINDYRPTTGVVSEVIHPLDLIQWINFNSSLNIKHIQGVRSDFSISGDNIPDSVSVIGELNNAIVTGYSSFVSLFRRRELDFVFLDKKSELVFAKISFDTPKWYEDSLLIWRDNNEGSETLLEFNSLEEKYIGDRRLERLTRVVKDISDFLILGKEPKTNFASLDEAIKLQILLNQIASNEKKYLSVKYNRLSKRNVLTEKIGIDRLG